MAAHYKVRHSRFVCDTGQGRWPSEAMHGWDKAIATMHRGETATVILGPQYAFGARGAPPKIPPNATLECSLELIDWVDLVVRYNAVPGKKETDSERMERWKRDLAEGTSPMREEGGECKAALGLVRADT